MKIKTITMKVNEQEHKELKILATQRGGSIKDFLLYCVNLYKESGEDKDWNNLMKSLKNAPEEEPDEIDLQIMERAKIEKARGEIEDYEDDLKELDNESPDN